MTRLSWCFSCVIGWGKYFFSCLLPLRFCFCLRSQALDVARIQGPPKMTWICLSCMLWPEDLEAPKTHHFKVKTFKKVKPCGICRQVITREGCTCKVCSFSCHRKCQAKFLWGRNWKQLSWRFWPGVSCSSSQDASWPVVI